MSPTAEHTYGSRRGVTLIELLVAMAIFIAVISSVIVMFNSVTNTVRRSYRTMDAYEQARSSLLAVERDVKVSFAAPAAGADLQFYGEPYGFVLIGVSPEQELGRLSYAVHRDTSRMTAEGRGEIITVFRNWAYLQNDNLDIDLGVYYDLTDEYIEVEVEVVYGLLVRVYENAVTDMSRFGWIENVLQRPESERTSFMPQPRILNLLLESSWDWTAKPVEFPWLSKYLWQVLDPAAGFTASVPWYARSVMEKSEACHYWIQLLQGPGIRPARHWDLTNLWWSNAPDQYWFDVNLPSGPPFNPNNPNETRKFLSDYVVARDFVLETYLLDPATGQRIVTVDGRTVPVVGPNPYMYDDGTSSPNYDPIFQYAVEQADNRKTKFNTLFNLDHGVEVMDTNDVVVDSFNAFQRLTEEITGNPVTPNVERTDLAVSKMTEPRQFYDLGSPLQTRMPASFDITFWVLNDTGVTGAPTDLFRFSQTIQLPAGFLRRSQSVR